jgi:hypothetical protein
MSYISCVRPGVCTGVVVEHASHDLNNPFLSISISVRSVTFFEVYTDGGKTACLKQG